MFSFLKKKPQEGFNLDLSESADDAGHCLISGNIYLRGDVHFAGTLRLDGRIDGKISVYDGKKGVLVLSKGAVVNGPIVVTNMLADGTVNGDITVTERIECRSNAVIRGQVQYQAIHIAEGARIEGRCIKRERNELLREANKGGATSSFLATRDVQGSK